jgi:hypothetical protein
MDSFSLKGIIIGSVCAILTQAQSYGTYNWKKYTDANLETTKKVATSYRPYVTKYSSTTGISGYKAPASKPYS